MREILVLTKVLLKNSLNTNKEKKNVKLIAKNIFLFLVIAYIAFVIGFLSKEVIDMLRTAGQTTAFLSLCLLLTLAVSIFRSILSALNVMYFSKDIEHLLPLPVEPIKLILAKFNVMLVSSYLMNLLIIVVPFSVYGVCTMQEPLFYIMSLVVFLFFPIIPTLIGIIISVILMRFMNFSKNKDFVQYFTVIVAFVLVIGMQIFMIKNSDMTAFVFANKLLEVDGLARVLGNYFITLKQGVNAVTEFEKAAYITDTLYLIIESITAYFISAFLISSSYIKSATNIVSGKNVKKAQINSKTTKEKKLWVAYVEKDLKLLCRTPAFFLNTVVPIIILPVMICISVATAMSDSSSLEEIYAFLTSMTDSLENTVGMAIFLCAIIFLYMFNYTSITSVSREGQDALFMKYIPIELHKQCRYKAIPSILFNTFSLILVILCMKFIFSVNNIFIFEIAFVGILMNIFISYFGIILDVIKPKLHWTNEYAVVKQNMNILWYTIFVVIVGMLTFVICSYFENIHIATFFLSALIILTTKFCDNFLKQNSNNIFKKIS